jgi:hypothetical protein
MKIRWPEDKEFDEKEHFVWSVFKPEDWRKQGHLSWRYAPCELAKRAAMHAPKRRREE